MAVDIETSKFNDVVYIWPKMQTQEFAELVADIKTRSNQNAQETQEQETFMQDV
jgi:hypothetical protein